MFKFWVPSCAELKKKHYFNYLAHDTAVSEQNNKTRKLRDVVQKHSEQSESTMQKKK